MSSQSAGRDRQVSTQFSFNGMSSVMELCIEHNKCRKNALMQEGEEFKKNAS